MSGLTAHWRAATSGRVELPRLSTERALLRTGFLSLGRQRAFCALLPAAWDVKRARPDPRTRGPPSDPARRVPQIVVRARSEHSGGDLRAGARPHLRSPDLRAHLALASGAGTADTPVTGRG